MDSSVGRPPDRVDRTKAHQPQDHYVLLDVEHVRDVPCLMAGAQHVLKFSQRDEQFVSELIRILFLGRRTHRRRNATTD